MYNIGIRWNIYVGPKIHNIFEVLWFTVKSPIVAAATINYRE